MNSTNITAPPSKSMSHRAAIAAALAKGNSRLFNILESEDLSKTLDCLQKLGTKINPKNNFLEIRGINPSLGSIEDSEVLDLNVGESGTTCRLITPLVALAGKPCRIYGEGRMSERPIGELTRALQKQGAEITWLREKGYPPFVIESQGLTGNEIEISLEQSSQFLSGLLLAAPFAENSTYIYISGNKAVSLPYVGLTLQVMQEFGISAKLETCTSGLWKESKLDSDLEIVPGKIRFFVNPGNYKPRDYSVEGDWSNASYFLAAASLFSPGVNLQNLLGESLQGDREMLEILRRMGAICTDHGDSISVQPAELRGTELDMGNCPDLVPTVAVLSSLAKSPSRIFNVAHLRIKESDRLSALAAEISKTGCDIRVTPDGLDIKPLDIARGEKVDFKTYGDHRLAMSLCLYELAGIRPNLDQPECVKKSFPDFWEKWEQVRKTALNSTT